MTMPPTLCDAVDRTPVLRSVLSTTSIATSMSPHSTMSSPSIQALTDITPLPSPIIAGESSGMWHRLQRSASVEGDANPPSRHASTLPMPAIPSPALAYEPYLSQGSAEVLHRSTSSPRYARRITDISSQLKLRASASIHSRSPGRDRHVSEFVPEPLQNIKPRCVTGPVKSSVPFVAATTTEFVVGLVSPRLLRSLHREHHFTTEHGSESPMAAYHLTRPKSSFPTPPSSNRSGAESDEDNGDSIRTVRGVVDDDRFIGVNAQSIVTIKSGSCTEPQQWQLLRQLGQGTFSTVMLATLLKHPPTPSGDSNFSIPNMRQSEQPRDDRPLAAIKIVSRAVDNDRLELILQREVDIMQSLAHPTVVQLQAFGFDAADRAMLVLPYCAGGDLFELASEHRSLLTPALVRRIFSELAAAVCYLHRNFIVHRDVKLESELLPAQISSSIGFSISLFANVD